MSKTTYKHAMQRATAEEKDRRYARKTNPATAFIPSKDNPVELVTASFGSPRTVEVERRPIRSNHPGKRNKVPRI